MLNGVPYGQPALNKAKIQAYPVPSIVHQWVRWLHYTGGFTVCVHPETKNASFPRTILVRACQHL
ncbi:hypothetical protein ACRRVB_00270 [Candidatus Cardinium hertigii]|uniref:hypothetical protein n=1 Tax=Candidatus Cardinium hertigii TaxID=247481 RepID=UPI003D7DAD6A